jgi:hypothetical protein
MSRSDRVRYSKSGPPDRMEPAMVAMQFLMPSLIRAAAILAGIAGAGAAPVRESAPDIPMLIDNLGADEWSVRQAASDQLLAAEPRGVDILVPHLGGPLSPEQRLRLGAVAFERFFGEPHAGLGVSFDRAPVDDYDTSRPFPVVINTTEEGFDARIKLRRGDTITTMDGRALRNTEDMRAAIISHRPGDTVPMTLIRGGMQIELEVTLGDFAALNNAQQPNEFTLARALELRLERGGAALDWTVPVVAGPAPAGDDLLASRAQGGTIALPGENDEFAALAVGGEARGQLRSPALASRSGSPNVRGVNTREQVYGSLSRAQLEQRLETVQTEIAALEAQNALPANATDDQRRRHALVQEQIRSRRFQERAIIRELGLRVR